MTCGLHLVRYIFLMHICTMRTYLISLQLFSLSLDSCNIALDPSPPQPLQPSLKVISFITFSLLIYIKLKITYHIFLALARCDARKKVQFWEHSQSASVSECSLQHAERTTVEGTSLVRHIMRMTHERCVRISSW